MHIMLLIKSPFSVYASTRTLVMWKVTCSHFIGMVSKVLHYGYETLEPITASIKVSQEVDLTRENQKPYTQTQQSQVYTS